MTIPPAPDPKRGSSRTKVVSAVAALLVLMVLAVACREVLPGSGGAEEQPSTPGHVVVGVGVRDLTSVDLQRAGGSDLSGAYIGQVSPGSPAERAGLRIGDVVTQANEQPIVRAEQLQRLIGIQQGGAVIRLVIRRAGRTFPVQVTARQESGRIG